jgi:large subunit ribosomal protein L4
MAEETQTFEAAAFTALGTSRDRVALPATPFDGVVNTAVMHQAVKSFLANQRQATAYTKTRGLVTGGNQKPWKQKGTGRARQGSTRAPHWPGGGTVFGPHGDRNYNETVPRQVRALARRSALNARATTGDVVVVDRFSYEKPKTAVLRAALERIGVADKKVLILTDGSKPAVHLSARNMPNVHTLPYNDASTYHILWSDVVVIEAIALGTELAPVSEKHSTHKPARKRATREAAASSAQDAKAAAASPKKKPAKKAAKVAAHKKPAAKKPARKAAAKKPAAKKPSTRKKGK